MQVCFQNSFCKSAGTSAVVKRLFQIKVEELQAEEEGEEEAAEQKAAQEEELLPELQGQGSRVHRATIALPTPALGSILPQTCSATTQAVSTLQTPLIAPVKHDTC